MPDNDITYTQYTPDIEAVFRFLHRIFGGNTSFDTWLEIASNLWSMYVALAFLLSALFILGIVRAYIIINNYAAATDAELEAAHAMWKQLHNGTKSENQRWQEIQQHINTESPNDWKLAIIEADIMLGEALTDAGYAGVSIGEQLKSASPTQLTTLDDAWTAHRVRNRIAHEGGDFILTKAMANEAIVKYERSLRELSYL